MPVTGEPGVGIGWGASSTAVPEDGDRPETTGVVAGGLPAIADGMGIVVVVIRRDGDSAFVDA
jgi:hypothetical protein